jgi:transaldolase
MGGMWPTKATFDAYNEAKSAVPAAMKEAEATLVKAQSLAAALAKHGITLEVPATKVGTSLNNR